MPKATSTRNRARTGQADRNPAPATPKAEAVAADAPKGPDGATSGVMAQGATGRAARDAAHAAHVDGPNRPTGWRDPNAQYADDDQSIDARMWRTYTKGIRAQ
jgi:hypothetical protein